MSFISTKNIVYKLLKNKKCGKLVYYSFKINLDINEIKYVNKLHECIKGNFWERMKNIVHAPYFAYICNKIIRCK